MTKKEYRHIYKKERLALSMAEKKKFDDMILSQLTALDWTGIRYVHLYMAIEQFNEPDTMSFVSYLRTSFPSIQLVLSKSDFDKGTLINYLWDDTVVLEKNAWGILEPVNGTVVEDTEIDVVLVPLLVVDKLGNRVGYGKGFYDRFLAQCKSTVQKIGLSYFAPVDIIDDVDAWDIPIDRLITPSQGYNF